MREWEIPDHLYDGLMHRIAFTKSEDFLAKWSALRNDGFSVALEVTGGASHILAFKAMSGDPIPPLSGDEDRRNA